MKILIIFTTLVVFSILGTIFAFLMVKLYKHQNKKKDVKTVVIYDINTDTFAIYETLNPFVKLNQLRDCFPDKFLIIKKQWNGKYKEKIEKNLTDEIYGWYKYNLNNQIIININNQN